MTFNRLCVLAVLTVLLPGQTTVNPLQTRGSIVVVERALCVFKTAQGVTPVQDCTGLELYRFRLADGSLIGPFIAMPVPSDFVKDPPKWQNVPLTP